MSMYHSSSVQRLLTRALVATTAFLFIASPTLAGSTSSIAVWSPTEQLMTYLDSSGTEVATSELLPAFSKKKHLFYTAELREKAGSEWVVFRKKGKKKIGRNTLTITNQRFKKSENQQVFSLKRHQKIAMAIGDVSTLSDGPEIVLCQQKHRSPSLTVYGYGEDGGLSELWSVTPFGEESTSKRGCGGIAIGDIDGDDEQEVLVVQNKKRAATIYDAEGEIEDEITLPGKYRSGVNNTKGIYLADTDGDDRAEVIYVSEATLYMYSDRNTTYKSYSVKSLMKKKQVGSVAVADVDGDGDVEVVLLQKNTTGTMYVISHEGVVEDFFDSAPDAAAVVQRHVVLGTFVH